jgi:hypothetical protein
MLIYILIMIQAKLNKLDNKKSFRDIITHEFVGLLIKFNIITVSITDSILKISLKVVLDLFLINLYSK